MKIVFKLLLLSIVLSIGMLSAQKYSVEAGFISPKQNGTGLSDTYFNGIRVGALAEFDLPNNFSFLTGALYSVVYSNKVQKYSVSSDSVTYTTYGHYIDIPLRIQYSLPIGKDFRIFAFAGPNINVGLAMPQRVNAVLTNDIAELTGIQSVDYGENDLFKEAMISRINFQMGAGGGVQWRNYQLKGGYDFGINSINKIDSSNTLRQSGWYVSLVYQF